MAQDATFDNLTVNSQLVSETAILSALEVTGNALFNGLEAGGQITGLADGTASDHAVNFGQLEGVRTTADAANVAAIAAQAAADAGWNLGDGTAQANIGPKGTVTFQGDGNISVALTGTDDNGTVTVALDPDLNVTSVTTGNATLNSNGLIFAGGPSITSTGIDAGGIVITNLADGELTATSSDAVTGKQIFDLFIEEGAGGVRYFRARSAQPDSQALGDESIAIGPNTAAEGESSFAAGDGALTTEEGEGAIALGQGAQAGGADSGSGGAGAIAVGRGSTASGTSTVALGDAASASGSNATALGGNAQASGDSSIAIGSAVASAANGVAAGAGAEVAAANSIALGVNAGVGMDGSHPDRTDHIAIGTAAGQNVVGNQSTAIGYAAGSGVIGDHNIALGSEAGRDLQGNNNISIGAGANDGAGNRAQAIAIGDGTAAGSDSVAMGSGATAQGSETLALGKDSSAGANGVALGAHTEAEGSNIALGRNSAALDSDLEGYSGYLTGTVAPGSAVSVGNSASGLQRRITNVADGSQQYDAVNVGQLQGAQRSVATLIGGGVTLNADGSYSPITVQDTGGNDHEFNTVVEAIGAVTSGSVDILPVDAVRYNAEGGISNVAAGVSATDAVNVGQLNQVVAENGVKYYSANSTVSANRNNDGATGLNAMAVGPAAVASGETSVAIGYAARVNAGADSGVAIGHDVSARAIESTVIGSRSHAYDLAGVAIGHEAVSRGENSIVIGTGAEADPTSGSSVDNAIVIGTQAEATADDGIAIGQEAQADGVRSVAQGFYAHAEANDSQAFGTRAHATGVSAQASGTDATASGVNAQASGTRASASGVNAIASGTDARGYATDGIAMGTGAAAGFSDPFNTDPERNTAGIAIGNQSQADQQHALALGVEAEARAASSTAIGDGAEATATAQDGLAIGSGARVTAQNAAAFGQSAEAAATDALAVGSGALANQQSASAVGQNAQATAQNAAAFGSGAHASHQGSVALGSGAVTTDPVGTSSTSLNGINYGGFAGDNPIATVSVGTNTEKRTITNVAAGRINAASTDAINGSQLFATNTVLGNVANSLADGPDSVLGGNATVGDDGTITMSDIGGTGEDTVHDAIGYAAQGWDISAQGGAEENVTPGGSVDFSNTDGNINIARNGTDLTFDLDDDIEIGNSVTVGNTAIDGDSVTANNLTVSGTTHLGDNFVVNNDNSVTYNGTEIATQNDGLSFAGNTGSTISKALGDTAPLTLSGGLAAGEDSTGNNLRVDSDGSQLNLVMARNLTGLDSITITGGPVINGSGINMDGTRITNLAPGVDGTDAVNVSQLDGEIADVISEGLNFSANVGGDVHRDLGETLAIRGGMADTTPASQTSGENVITRTTTTGGINIELANDVTFDSVTTGDTVMDDSGVAVGDDVQLSDTGLTVDDGAGNVTSTTVDGTTVTNAVGDSTTVGAGTIDVADANGTTTIGGNQIAVGGNNPILVSGDSGTIEGLTNVDLDGADFANAGRAATEE
ncbi:beta strand repeat-containing protein, partial [Halomonas dongshanensis]